VSPSCVKIKRILIVVKGQKQGRGKKKRRGGKGETGLVPKDQRRAVELGRLESPFSSDGGQKDLEKKVRPQKGTCEGPRDVRNEGESFQHLVQQTAARAV